jgi:hypothetical protein
LDPLTGPAEAFDDLHYRDSRVPAFRFELLGNQVSLPRAPRARCAW